VFPPVQNARAPDPVITTATAARSADARRIPAITPLIISVVYELSWPGLSSVIRTTCKPCAMPPVSSRSGDSS
jgi:hypothetical protein